MTHKPKLPKIISPEILVRPAKAPANSPRNLNLVFALASLFLFIFLIGGSLVYFLYWQ